MAVKFKIFAPLEKDLKKKLHSQETFYRRFERSHLAIPYHEKQKKDFT